MPTQGHAACSPGVTLMPSWSEWGPGVPGPAPVLTACLMGQSQARAAGGRWQDWQCRRVSQSASHNQEGTKHHIWGPGLATLTLGDLG